MNFLLQNLLTPNQQLFAYFGLTAAGILSFAIACWVVLRRLAFIEGKFSGEVVPLWQHLRTELAAIMRHPHPWAAEMDALLDEALLEPEVPMKPERYERFLILLAERVLSTSPDLRENEARAATIWLNAIPLARSEQRSLKELTGIVLVGSISPKNQSMKDAEIRLDAT